jgi:hypothetical protein
VDGRLSVRMDVYRYDAQRNGTAVCFQTYFLQAIFCKPEVVKVLNVLDPSSHLYIFVTQPANAAARKRQPLRSRQTDKFLCSPSPEQVPRLQPQLQREVV